MFILIFETKIHVSKVFACGLYPILNLFSVKKKTLESTTCLNMVEIKLENMVVPGLLFLNYFNSLCTYIICNLNKLIDLKSVGDLYYLWNINVHDDLKILL